MSESRTIIITGGNTGIGFAIALEAAKQHHHIILACRNQEKAEAARQKILDSVAGAKVDIRILDLSSLDSVREFANVIAEDFPVVDVLVNNAGVYPMEEQHTQEGFEMQFGVNYLGHFLLTHLLLPVLMRSQYARIVHMSSIGHYVGRIRFDTFYGRRFYLSGIPGYAQSKLANVMFSNELARRLPPQITSNAVHPGFVDSDFFRNTPGPVRGLLHRILVTPETAAKFTVAMAVGDDWAGRSGEFVSAQGPLPKNRKLRDQQLSLQLYSKSCQLTGVEPVAQVQRYAENTMNKTIPERV